MTSKRTEREQRKEAKEKQAEQIRALSEKGLSNRAIKEQMGVSYYFVYNVVNAKLLDRRKSAKAEIIEEQADTEPAPIPADRRDKTGRAFGDPVFERSALGQQKPVTAAVKPSSPFKFWENPSPITDSSEHALR